MPKIYITKRRLIVALTGLLVLVGCLLVLASSIRQLPPGTVRPNAKPALNLSKTDQASISVNASPVDHAAVSVTKASASSPSATTCDQPQASQTQQASSAPLSSPDSSLATLRLPSTSAATDLGSKLQTKLLNVAGGLGQ